MRIDRMHQIEGRGTATRRPGEDHLERAVRAEFREGGKLAESGFLE